MGKFDTHGGYFAPQGYIKVETGGSHEENPNGGVQVGVDPQGIPNMLEEGEPVYNDYVYSDNIIAEEDILAKHNIPTKYAGKLYSDIADAYVDEAAEMPLDPIANNGLNAMLVRLADAQEEQKAIQQQKELEEELSKLSPEELAELEQVLAAQEQQEAQPVEAMPQQVMPQAEQQPVEEQMYMQQPMEQPMMACGGHMKRAYWPGGTLLKTAVQRVRDFGDTPLGDAVLQEIGLRPKMVVIGGEEVPVVGGIGVMGAVAGPGELKAIQGMRAAKNAKVINEAMDAAYAGTETTKAAATGKAADVAKSVVDKTKEVVGKVKDTVKGAAKPEKAPRRRKVDMSGWGRMFYDPSFVGRRAAKSPELSKWGKIWRSGLGSVPAMSWELPAAGALVEEGVNRFDARHNASTKAQYEAARRVDPFAEGGQMNLFWPGGNLFGYPGATFTLDKDYKIYSPYSVTSPFILSNPYNYGPVYNEGSGQTETQTQVPAPSSDGYKYTFIQPTTLLDTYNSQWTPGRTTPIGIKSFYSSPSPSTRYSSSYSGPSLGTGARRSSTPTATKSAVAPVEAQPNLAWQRLHDSIMDAEIAKYQDAEDAGYAKYLAEKEAMERENEAFWNRNKEQGKKENKALPTWPRYAGAITSGLLGLYNAFQEPDKYNIRHYRPVLPSARMHLVDPVYTPIDQNQLVNDVLANSAGTARAIRNSGMGPSLGATLLAQDYNTGRNIGAARRQAWEANNAARNAVIAAHNQNASTLGNFHYGQNKDWATILNDAAVRNAQNDFMLQRMNYAAEGEKYAAIQNQTDALSKALADIGRENAVMNMIDGDETRNYRYDSRFDPYYSGYLVSYGGKIKRKK